MTRDVHLKGAAFLKTGPFKRAAVRKWYLHRAGSSVQAVGYFAEVWLSSLLLAQSWCFGTSSELRTL
jgi:hypothetical protein